MTLAESGDSTEAFTLADLFDGAKIAGVGGPTVEHYTELLVRGGWPALVAQPGRSAQEYLSSYLDDVTLVDLPHADLRADPLRMRALIRALARNVSTEISAAKLSKEAEIGTSDTEVSAQTVRKYLDALTRVFVIEEQPAWATHLRSKVQSPLHHAG